MPRYCYRCDACEHQFEIVHSIKENLFDCKKCDSKDVLKRVPFPVRVEKKGIQKTGDIVNNFIKDTKEEINKEKKDLKKREYKP